MICPCLIVILGLSQLQRSHVRPRTKIMSSSRKITQKSLVNFAILKSFKIHPDQWEPVLSVSKVYSSTVFQSLAFHHETMLVHNMEKHDEPSWFLARFWILVSGFYFQCIAGVYPTYNWVDDHSATDLMTAKCWTFDPYTSTLLVGGLEHLDYYFFIYWECHIPNCYSLHHVSEG